jgi:predicted TIM-barrel fold metal-dependent hydrolase
MKIIKSTLKNKVIIRFHTLSIVVISIIFCCNFTSLGGNFSGQPQDLEKNISEGAKNLIAKSYADVDVSKLHDHHVHLIGIDKNLGTEVNEKLLSWLHPLHRIKTQIYMSASGINDMKNANQEYITRLISLIDSNKNYGKIHILAFDRYYNQDGNVNNEKSEFYVANDYMFKIYEKYPNIFVPVISVHPYRKDALQELEKWAKKGVRWVKWLPNAQGINPASPKIDDYYQMMKKYNMTLLTHVGEEQAVESEEDQNLGNPLLLRRALDSGVRVVMAHCASLGKDKDLDNGNKKVPSFDLFIRLMNEKKYEGLLFGEISATTQFNRLPRPILTLLEHKEWHNRLINGSDYPLPAINVIVHTRSLIKYGMITKEERKYLNEIYQYNPLIFDYVLKRTIKHPQSKAKFDPVIFGDLENRRSES